MVYLLLLLLPAALVLPFALAGYGLGNLGRTGVRRAGRQVWLRSGAALLGAVAAALYASGLLCVAAAVLDAEDGGTGSAPLRPCRTTDRPERSLTVVDYSVRYAPLRFVCEQKDGGAYAADSVPGFVNPAVVAFALAAVTCAAGAGFDTRRTARPSPVT